MHLYGDSNLHTKKKENPSNFTPICFTFLACTKDTKELLMSHSILVELAFRDKNKKCKKNTRVVWKTDCYVLILHFYTAFLWEPGLFSNMHIPVGWGWRKTNMHLEIDTTG